VQVRFVPKAVQASPQLPVNVESDPGVAVRTTVLLAVKFAEQTPLWTPPANAQLIPAGLLVTAPDPVPPSATVRGFVPRLKVAVQVLSPVAMLTVKGPDPVQSPLQATDEFGPAVGVS
jgi:hypothetical protein